MRVSFKRLKKGDGYKTTRSRAMSNREAREFLDWLAIRLLGPRLSRSVSVIFEWQKYPDEKAACEWADRSVRPRRFNLYCNPNLSHRTTMLCLAHEMVHVEQYATGKLKTYLDESRNTRWKRTFVNEKNVPETRTPWEREATRLEKSLYAEYREHLRCRV